MSVLRAVPELSTFPPRIAALSDIPPTKATYLDAEGRLTCPQCKGHDFRTPDTEPWKGGAKVRYKRCFHCGFRIRTKEIIDDE